MEDKFKFGMFVIAAAGIIQGVAWITGNDGALSGAVMGVIGLTAGTLLGFTYGKHVE